MGRAAGSDLPRDDVCRPGRRELAQRRGFTRTRDEQPGRLRGAGQETGKRALAVGLAPAQAGAKSAELAVVRQRSISAAHRSGLYDHVGALAAGRKPTKLQRRSGPSRGAGWATPILLSNNQMSEPSAARQEPLSLPQAVQRAALYFQQGRLLET